MSRLPSSTKAQAGMRRALITGITGQDGSYLAELLLSQGYEVHGIVRRTSRESGSALDALAPHHRQRIRLHEGDLLDAGSLHRILRDVEPEEIYNLAAQTHVGASFRSAELTAEVNGLGVLKLLQAVQLAGLTNSVRFYQASTSELFGEVQESPQSERTPFHPRSPYGVAKLFAHWTTVNFREAFGLFACSGILFNHESPRRGHEFVTRKITRGLVQFLEGRAPCIQLGNLDARRDWGHARDYVRAQWLMLQQDQPRDFVVATGTQHSVREFVTWAGADLGMTIEFEGTGSNEVGRVTEVAGFASGRVGVGEVAVRVSSALFRPAEVSSLVGDASDARQLLGWSPTVTARELCTEMVEADLRSAQGEMDAAEQPAADSSI